MRLPVTVLALLFALLHPLAQAAAPSAASIERLLDVTRAKKLNDQVLQQVGPMIRPTLDDAMGMQKLTPESRQQAEKFVASFSVKMNQIVAEEMSWERVKALNVQLYQESFTQEEVDSLITFYESPAGQAFIEKMPTVLQKSMALTQQRLVPMMNRLSAAAQETAREFRASQAPARQP